MVIHVLKYQLHPKVYKKASFPRFLSEIHGLSGSPIEAFGEKVNAACGREAALGYDGLEGI